MVINFTPTGITRYQTTLSSDRHDEVLRFAGEEVHDRDVKQFQGALAFKGYRLAYHSTLGWRVIQKKKKNA